MSTRRGGGTTAYVASADGTRIAHRAVGDGPAVVVVGGAPGPLVAEFIARG
ncbi:hypothetical protein [Kitasatospora fiedleri]|uniref:hypothetical protein n=1 Tax=Kitasatospora fiedleri TaxID=2991545 RepID=UPI00249CC84E|nr:hypothetical protein [Kitasatospora fiedleri]